MNIFWLVLLAFSGAALIGILFQAITGRRESGTVFNWVGFWRPPAVPEDEWVKWSKN